MRPFFLVISTVLLAAPALSADKLDRSRTRFATIDVGGHTNAKGRALVAWAQEVRLRTSIEVSQEPARVSLQSPHLFHYPLLYWSGDRGFDRLPDAAIARLRKHISTGGMLILDDVGRAGPSQAFDRSVRRMVRRAFGQNLERISPNHVLFRSFYRLGGPAGRRNSSQYVEGLRLGKRLAIAYTRNDLQGAFARAPTGGPLLRVIPGGEAQREQAYRFGINLVMYALCLHYKDDHAHVSKLLRHRRGRKPAPNTAPMPRNRDDGRVTK